MRRSIQFQFVLKIELELVQRVSPILKFKILKRLLKNDAFVRRESAALALSRLVRPKNEHAGGIAQCKESCLDLSSDFFKRRPWNSFRLSMRSRFNLFMSRLSFAVDWRHGM